MNSKLFWPENLGSGDPGAVHLLYSAGEIRRLDPLRDRLLLENIARNGSGVRRKAALRVLGTDHVPEKDPDYTSDGIFDEGYWLTGEQVLRVEDPELLKQAAFRGFGEKRYFAFCRLTGYRYPAPACDAYSHRTFAVLRFPDIAPGEVRSFCREMAERNGPFLREALACLDRLPESGAEGPETV